MSRAPEVRPEEQNEASEAENTNQYLTFKLGSETYALEVANAREILELTSITPIPQMPAWICGVINLRGSVVPVVDLATKLGMPSQPRTVNTCIIISELRVDNDLFVLGALVDAVQEVFEMEHDQIEPAPSFGSRISTEFIKGMGKRNGNLFVILNAERVLSPFERSLVQHAGEAGELASQATQAASTAAARAPAVSL